MNPLLIIVPTRSRPQNVGKVVDAWLETSAFRTADLLFAIDFDDPAHDGYLDALQMAARAAGSIGATIGCHSSPSHRPLVAKLNTVAQLHAELEPGRLAIGFAGDDHLPRTPGWAQIFDDHLRRAGTGIAYCDDGYQGENLASSWVMTADIVRALGGRMVPAPVDHLYCDNAVMDLGREAGCLSYLPGVLIEHVHPVAGKTPTDEQYERVNGREQYRRDRPAYKRWKRDGGLADDAARVRALIKGKTA